MQGVLVVLAPAVGVRNQIRYRGFQTDSDGTFDFQNVPSGDYLLFAVEDTELEYAHPTAVFPFLARAKDAKIGVHTVHSEKTGLTKALEESKR